MAISEQIASSLPLEPGWKIKIEHLSKRFEANRVKVLALQDVSLEIPRGQFFSIVGPSGCGKTTLLRIVGELETKTSGNLYIRLDQTTGKKRPVNSMIFQEQSVFPWMSVRDNIAFGLKARGIARSQRYAVAEEYIQKVGLAGFSMALPYQLSGGMKQRVSVARAFANDPEILLMDEPFGALDEQNRMILQEELLRVWEETQKTVLFVTHSIDEAIVLSDQIVVMSARPGRILEIIPVRFPRPRQIEAVRSDPAFGEIFNRVWKLLRHEVNPQG